jgi:hypothetical protein
MSKEQASRQEVRATDPSTGGQKGRKLARFDLLPWDALWLVAEHFGAGAAKYDDRNWERGYPWSWSYAALQRHLAAWWQGDSDLDEEGRPHIVAAAWHALVLVAFWMRGSGTDDRPDPTFDPGDLHWLYGDSGTGSDA